LLEEAQNFCDDPEMALASLHQPMRTQSPHSIQEGVGELLASHCGRNRIAMLSSCRFIVLDRPKIRHCIGRPRFQQFTVLGQEFLIDKSRKSTTKVLGSSLSSEICGL